MRDRFIHASSSYSDVDALEMLLSGYYVRCDTGFLSRRMLMQDTVDHILCNASMQNLEVCEGVDLYLGVCGELSMRTKAASSVAAPILPDVCFDLTRLCALLRPYFFSPEQRFCCLCLDQNFALIEMLFSRFGEESLPLAIEHCHKPQIRHVVLAFDAHALTKETLQEGIAYYLERLAAAERSFDVYGVLLLCADAVELIRLQDHQQASPPQP